MDFDILPPPVIKLVTRQSLGDEGFDRETRPITHLSTNILGEGSFELKDAREMMELSRAVKDVRALGRRMFDVSYSLNTQGIILKGRAPPGNPVSLQDDLWHVMTHGYFDPVMVRICIKPSPEFSRSIVCQSCAKMSAQYLLRNVVRPSSTGVHILCAHPASIREKLRAVRAEAEREVFDATHDAII